MCLKELPVIWRENCGAVLLTGGNRKTVIQSRNDKTKMKAFFHLAVHAFINSIHDE